MENISNLKGKTLLITGGTGSFGHAVLRRFLDYGLDEIRIFSRDEKKQHYMRLLFSNENRTKLKFILGDVRDPHSLLDATRNVDLIFHAAALKQVPSCEFFPMEAIRTNVMGTDHLITAAAANAVSKIIILSTDKAVYPINAMGLSKAMAEKIAISKAHSLGQNTTICVTRYGNVMNSRGSVIPLFADQLLADKELTITDPGITRFLMSLDSAVDLVVHAFNFGKSGDTFVQKAPACTVETLAYAVAKYFNKPARIKIIGLRHGEKKHETLVSREEMARAQIQESYFRIPSYSNDLNYASYLTEGLKKLAYIHEFSSDNTLMLDVNGVCSMLETAEID